MRNDILNRKIKIHENGLNQTLDKDWSDDKWIENKHKFGEKKKAFYTCTGGEPIDSSFAAARQTQKNAMTQ